MKVRVSKVMAKEIQKAMKERGLEIAAKVVTMSENEYCWNVGMSAMLDAKNNCDYDWYEDEFKVIKILYEDQEFACPQYVTTHMLDTIFSRECPNKTLQELMEAVCHEIEI